MSSQTKIKDFKTRTDIGNYNASMLADYMNHRFKMHLVCTTPYEDRRPKLDYRDIVLYKTFQMKYRESGQDIIHEDILFLRPIIGATTWKICPGRDYRCKADFYVVKPFQYSFEEQTIYVVKTNDVKDLCDEAIAEFGKYSEERINSLWAESERTANKSVVIGVSSKGIQVTYKIDEGKGNPIETGPYSKIICYVPEFCFEKYGKYINIIKLYPGENVLKSETWEESRIKEGK